MTDHAAEVRDAVAGAEACLDAFMAAFNARDLAAWEKTFNFPSVRLASGPMAMSAATKSSRTRSFISTISARPMAAAADAAAGPSFSSTRPT